MLIIVINHVDSWGFGQSFSFSFCPTTPSPCTGTDSFYFVKCDYNTTYRTLLTEPVAKLIKVIKKMFRKKLSPSFHFTSSAMWRTGTCMTSFPQNIYGPFFPPVFYTKAGRPLLAVAGSSKILDRLRVESTLSVLWWEIDVCVCFGCEELGIRREVSSIHNFLKNQDSKFPWFPKKRV